LPTLELHRPWFQKKSQWKSHKLQSYPWPPLTSTSRSDFAHSRAMPYRSAANQKVPSRWKQDQCCWVWLNSRASKLSCSPEQDVPVTCSMDDKSISLWWKTETVFLIYSLRSI
jgi:hypothetical protein